MRSFLLRTLLAFTLVAPVGAAPPAFVRQQGDFDALLHEHVRWNPAGTATVVEYQGFKNDRGRLRAFLAAAARIDAARFTAWSIAERQAFLINVYNAATIELVLTRYPALDSIKELGSLFSSAWARPFVSLLGEKRSLDDIEHRLLRGARDYRDVRIHFAVNCASIGCPALRPEAYVGNRLESQLDDQARRFLRDRTRNGYDARAGVLRVSRLFDWYAGDFDRHAAGVAIFLSRHARELALDKASIDRLERGQLPIAYTTYDWSLNQAMPTNPRKVSRE